MRVHASLLAIVLSTSVAAAGDAKTKKPAPAKPKTVEVCPQLRAVTIVPFWEDEEVWTKCPIAAPVLSIGGRCLDGTQTCMQPCARTLTNAKGEITETNAYTYDKTGHLIGAVNTSHFSGRSMDTKYTCERDEAGHRTKCTGLSGDTTYVHKDNAFVGTVTQSEGKTTAKTIVGRDKTNPDQITMTGWQDDRGVTRFDYTYNADGTLATSTSDDPRMKVKQSFTYTGGRLTKLRTEPSGGGFKPTEVTYTYDKAGRVTKETSTGQVNETITYSYDKAGRLTKLVRSTGTSKFTSTYQYICKK